MTSQRISDFLAAIGTTEKQMAFQKAYIRYVMTHYSPDKNILIDSSGIPNGIHMPATRINVYNGRASNEVRLIFVVQRTTGLPLYYRAIPGNIMDVTTLERIFLHLDSMGIDVDSCIMDAGYNSSDNMDLFYNENHECKIDFITRLKSGDKNFQYMVYERNIHRKILCLQPFTLMNSARRSLKKGILHPSFENQSNLRLSMCVDLCHSN